MKRNNNVAVILVNWKKYELTSKCIESIFESKYLNFKVILIDNQSDKLKISKFKWKKKIHTILNKSNEGFAKANNQGIEYALKNNFDYVLILNNDTIIKSNLILKLIEISQKRNLLAIQPLVLNQYGNKVWNGGGKINNFFGTFRTIKTKENSFKNIEWFTGCCCLFDIELFKEIGMFDEKFFAYYEDVDFSLRILKKGIRIGFTDETHLYHYGSVSSKSKNNFDGKLSPYVHYLNIRNHILVLRKHSQIFNPIGSVLYQALKIFSYSTYFIIRLRFIKLKMVFKGLKDSLKTQI